MHIMSGIWGPAAAAAALLLAGAVHAQDAATAPADAAPQAAQALPAPSADAPQAGGEALKDPHAMLPALTGGPSGSPTSQRGNPVPGTSTSIPTTNPATVRPLPRLGPDGQEIAVEDTGIEGQCDPVVTLGCPTLRETPDSALDMGAGNAGSATPAPAGAAQ